MRYLLALIMVTLVMGAYIWACVYAMGPVWGSLWAAFSFGLGIISTWEKQC